MRQIGAEIAGLIGNWSVTQKTEQYERAIDEGIKLFMRKGFVKVSIEDIVSSTSLNRYTIYSAFGTKADFFRVCVRRYCDNAVGSLERLVSDSSITPEEAARANLYAAAEEMFEVGSGCLVCDSITEMKQFTPDLAEYCRAYYDEKEKILVSFFTRAKQSGAISEDIDPEQAAAAFMIFKFGLSNEVKRTRDIEILKKNIDAFVSGMYRK